MTTPAGPLAAATIQSLRAFFDAKNHGPSPEMWSALTAVANTLEAMADGRAAPTVHLASLDPGVGKTQVVSHFIRVLLQSEAHEGVSVLVCAGRKRQIEDFIRDAALSNDDFAVYTADKALNKLGTGAAHRARVLFTTHSMVERRCDDQSFPEVTELHYRGCPRDVRVWDEAIVPGRAMTLSRDDVSSLLKPLRRPYPAFASALDQMNSELATMESGSLFIVPDLASIHDIELSAALAAVDGEDRPERREAISSLWFLFGRVVTVRRDGAYGTTILDYKETLPRALAPLLVLDASSREEVRATYRLWEDYRGGVVRLPAAPKDYSPLTLHLWRRGGGKTAFRRDGAELADGIAHTINQKLDEPWLVVFHKTTDTESDVRERLDPRRSGEVHFLNWGAHEATNAFANIPNVILAGTLIYPPSYYEGLSRAAAGRSSAHGKMPAKDVRDVELGEHRHVILQALCRGAVRKCNGASCPKVDAYIIASSRSGIGEQLPVIFPGVNVVPWRPVQRALKGKAGDAVRFIIDTLADGAQSVPFSAVRQHIGVGNAANFNRSIRHHAEFAEVIAEQGIVEWPPQRPIGFARAYAMYFGNEN